MHIPLANTLLQRAMARQAAGNQGAPRLRVNVSVLGIISS